MAHLTNYERETIINFNEGEDTASVYTHNKALRRRLEQLAEERPEECELFKVTHWGEAAEYYIPKSWLKIKPPRILSEAQLAQRREASKGTRFASNSGEVRQDEELAEPKTSSYIPEDPDGEKGGEAR